MRLGELGLTWVEQTQIQLEQLRTKRRQHLRELHRCHSAPRKAQHVQHNWAAVASVGKVRQQLLHALNHTPALVKQPAGKEQPAGTVRLPAAVEPHFEVKPRARPRA